MERKRIHVWITTFSDRSTLQLQWIDETGHKRTQSARTADRGEAESARVDLEADLNAGRYQGAARLSWSAFRETYTREHLSGTRPATQDSYGRGFDTFERLARPASLGAVNERTISLFVAALRREDYLASSIHSYLSYLHAALSWARKQKLIPTVPDFPSVKVPRKRPQPVALELAERLLEAADAPQRAFLLCAWLAGLRRSEALALRWEPSGRWPWLDLEHRPPRIWLPAEFVKGVEDQWVAVHAGLEAALRHLPRTDERVFTWRGQKGGFLSPACASSMVTVLARQAGVRLSMRALRRGFACRLAATVPAQVLQAAMRHKHIQTTMTFYASAQEAADQAVMGLADYGIGSATPSNPQETAPQTLS